MKTRRHTHRETAALTLVEVLIALGVVGVLFAVFVPGCQYHSAKAPRIKCVNNLKQIGLAFRIFASDHHEKFPLEISTRDGGSKEFVEFGLVLPHLLVISNELSTPKLLICPSDRRIAGVTFGELRDGNISYFVGLDANHTNPKSLVAGDRNITNGSAGNERMLFLTTNQPAGWTKEIHQHAGNVVFGDGSVQQLTSGRLRQVLSDSGVATNRLAVP